ncbi:plasminogen activator inhibitor 1 RNA-binding protein isoform X2 [Ictalurus punctatus]|uniref:Plasminogen activator inhibitor 1 RNA-binding protein isoform X2 n=1 Tax=Ictalurus punctatus TaxID=7998 RepID=A0A2D0T1H9_ICTPU|nr:plasminogen activator inhibitor 1 RNA-binding protein isoform X2 [Ictalurus punctatus]
MKELIEETPDSGYSCAVANRFGRLLDDESDPFDLLYQAQMKNEKRKKKEELKKVVTSAKPSKKESQRDRKAIVRVEDNPVDRAVAAQKRPVRATPEDRGERHVTFSEAKLNEGEVSLGYSIERPGELFDRAARGRGGGRVRGVRGVGYFRSADGFDTRGKREFERHSGSDRASVRPEEKRGGSGPRNWGSMRDHVSAVAEGAHNEETVEGEEVPDTAETELENGPVDAEEVIEVAIEMSLDEWKAIQEQSRPKAEFNIRKADTKLPPKAVVIHKSKRLKERGLGLNEEDLVCRRPTNDITCQVDINFGSLGRPSRGGRGGRGGRGRGAPATQRSLQKDSEVAPNPDDPEDFPALA